MKLRFAMFLGVKDSSTYEMKRDQNMYISFDKGRRFVKFLLLKIVSTHTLIIPEVQYLQKRNN